MLSSYAIEVMAATSATSSPTRPAPELSVNSRGFPRTPPQQPTVTTSPPVSYTNDVDSSATSPSSKRRGSFSRAFTRAAPHEIPTTRSTSQSGRTATMLRKHKVREQEESLRQQRLASQVSQQPPQLASPAPMPIIDGFGALTVDSIRPDSVAMFSGKMHEHQLKFREKSPVNNFSRPGYVAKSPSNNTLNSTTSASKLRQKPSYTSINMADGVKHGEMVDPYAMTESMTNRGRESYASPVLNAGGHVNSPRRVRRRKDPTPFNVLVIGAKKTGKTSFIEFLKTSLALPVSKRVKSHSPVEEEVTVPSGSAFTPAFIETDLDGERVGLTLWDSMGLEKNVVDLQLREITSFIESKFEETFIEEQKVVRSPGAKDTHIHCVLLLLDPGRLDTLAVETATSRKQPVGVFPAQTLDEELDLQTMRALSGKTTVVPIISKADTLTNAHMAALKRSVWTGLQAAKLDPLEALGLEAESDEDGSSEELSSEDVSGSDLDLPIQGPLIVKDGSAANSLYDESSLLDNYDHSGSSLPNSTLGNNASSGMGMNVKSTNANFPVSTKIVGLAISQIPESPTETTAGLSDEMYIPFSILSPDPYTLPHTLTRAFPWGEADPLNSAHCDFARLRESVFCEWRDDLRAASREKWYEGWRTSRLHRSGIVTGRIRQAGGVTPARVIPRGGRTSPVSSRKTSAADSGYFPAKNIRTGSGRAEKLLGSPKGLAM